MQVQASSELAFYDKQAGQTATTLTALAVFVGVVMGIGAVFGAMNTMYGLVSSRTREIGTLRALGLLARRRSWPSFMIESAFLALVAGVLGCVLALPVNTLSGATGGANFSEVAFAFRISPLWLAIARGRRGDDGNRSAGSCSLVPRGTNANHGGAQRRVNLARRAAAGFRLPAEGWWLEAAA